MSKQLIVDELKKKFKDVSKQALNDIYDNLFKMIVDNVKKKKKLIVIGFGTFKQVDKKATIKRNPKTQKEIKVPAKKVLKFKASKGLKF